MTEYSVRGRGLGSIFSSRKTDASISYVPTCFLSLRNSKSFIYSDIHQFAINEWRYLGNVYKLMQLCFSDWIQISADFRRKSTMTLWRSETGPPTRPRWLESTTAPRLHSSWSARDISCTCSLPPTTAAPAWASSSTMRVSQRAPCPSPACTPDTRLGPERAPDLMIYWSLLPLSTLWPHKHFLIWVREHLVGFYFKTPKYIYICLLSS